MFNLFGRNRYSGKFRQSLTLDDATYTADRKTLDTAQFNEVWKLRVPAQQIKTFGYGGIVSGVDDRGVIYLDFKDNTSNQIEGKVRLVISDANQTREIVLLEERTERLRASKTDLTQAYRLAEQITKAREDSYLIIKLKPDASATFSKANSDAVIPVTTYTL
jgi:hypothetical protein